MCEAPVVMKKKGSVDAVTGEEHLPEGRGRVSLGLTQQREAATRAAHLSPRDVDVRELWGRQPDRLCEGQEASEQRGAARSVGRANKESCLSFT